MPTPIEVATNIDLHVRKSKDTCFDYGASVTITAATTMVMPETAKAGEPLPTATYDVVAALFPR